jgi:hypothetical protein
MKKITRKVRKFVRVYYGSEVTKEMLLEEMRFRGYAYVDGSFGEKESEIDISTKMWGRFIYVGKKRVIEIPIVCKKERG